MLCIGLTFKLRLKSLLKQKTKDIVGVSDIYSKKGIRFKIETPEETDRNKTTQSEKFESIHAWLDSEAWEDYKEEENAGDEQENTSEADDSLENIIDTNEVLTNNQKYSFWSIDEDNLLIESLDETNQGEIESFLGNTRLEETNLQKFELNDCYVSLPSEADSLLEESGDEYSEDESSTLSCSWQFQTNLSHESHL